MNADDNRARRLQEELGDLAKAANLDSIMGDCDRTPAPFHKYIPNEGPATPTVSIPTITFDPQPTETETDGDYEITQSGSEIIFDSGHSIKVQNDRDEITTLIEDAGYSKNTFIYVEPWWQIDIEDQVAVKVDRIVAVRRMREIESTRDDD